MGVREEDEVFLIILEENINYRESNISEKEEATESFRNKNYSYKQKWCLEKKKKDFYKTILTVGFKCCSRNGAAIIEGLDRQNGVSKKKPISMGHVLQIVRTTISFESKHQREIFDTI